MIAVASADGLAGLLQQSKEWSGVVEGHEQKAEGEGGQLTKMIPRFGCDFVRAQPLVLEFGAWEKNKKKKFLTAQSIDPYNFIAHT